MSKLSDYYFNTLYRKTAELVPSTATTPEERANEILRPSGAGTLLADIVSPYANQRAGRATEVARSLGESAPLSIAYPETASALSALGGGIIGGGLGALTGTPTGAAVGALGGGALGIVANMLRRHAVISRVRQDLINKLTNEGMQSITPHTPDFNDPVTDYVLPAAAPARQGQAQAYKALLTNSKLPASGMNSSALNAAQLLSRVAAGTVGGAANVIAPGSGLLVTGVNSLANAGVNIGRNVSARNLVEGKTASEKLMGGLADEKPDSDFDKNDLSMGVKEELGSHTNDKQVAKEIAKDHLVEDPEYYEHEKDHENKYASAYFGGLSKVAKSVVMHKKDKSPTGGLTQSGRNKYNRETGSNLKAPVTQKNPKGKSLARKKSFCARMSGVKGPMKDEHGKPTRKALALRKWRCG
jgi:hypothetical protein